MGSIIQSPAKIVFVLIALTVCVGFFMKLLEPKDFMVLAGMAFGFYFGAPVGGSNNLPVGDSK